MTTTGVPAYFFFFFNATATTEIYTLSLHDALPILEEGREALIERHRLNAEATRAGAGRSEEHTSELQSRPHLVCRLLLEKKKRSFEEPIPPARSVTVGFLAGELAETMMSGGTSLSQ